MQNVHWCKLSDSTIVVCNNHASLKHLEIEARQNADFRQLLFEHKHGVHFFNAFKA
jgi:hypothetical protein